MEARACKGMRASWCSKGGGEAAEALSEKRKSVILLRA
mgnify:CR=1 FL=1